MPDSLTMGRQAIQRNDWGEALEALTEVDQHEGLGPDDLLLLGDAYWWTGKPDQAEEVIERAYAGFIEVDRPTDASVAAALLAYFAMRRMAMSVSAGWVARAEHLLEGEPESLGHGWLKVIYLANALLVDRDLDAAVRLADDAIATAKNLGSPGLHSLAMSFKGIALIQKGEWREGISLVDEATVVAMSGQGDLRAASDVYCNTIAACSNLGDYRRAGEWTEQAERWMRSHSVGGYTGICQVHRAELKRLHGSWVEAEQEARTACVELERFHLLNGIGFAYYEIGEVRRRMGDLNAAEEAFHRAYEYGNSAQPGMSLLLMDKGDLEGAAASIARAVARRGGGEGGTASVLSQARLLPAQTEIALRIGDLGTAKEAVTRLEDAADHYEGVTWRASALTCRGALDLAEGELEHAVEVLGSAWRLWQEVDLPYESAQARLVLGQARRAAGDEVGASLEFGAARSVFERLGAATDLRRLDELTGRAETGERPESQRVTKVFMFTDIVTSTDLIGIIGDAAWEDLLKWHDRVLRDSIGRHGGHEVRHTGDGFFVTFDEVRPAIECAVAIQRDLERHRREHGFAPWVRIGMHLAEATMQAGDYSGQGVHAAARVGALADREEIVVSSATVEAAGKIPYALSEPLIVELKGISEPMQVQRVDWHRSG
ncbi:MAG: adenylate/guanylate cyclase domain-containing protein [Acidimicrobiia bacterium]